MNPLVRAHGQGRSDGFQRPCRTNGNDGDFSTKLFLQSQGLFHTILVIRIHDPFNTSLINARSVRLHLDQSFSIRNLLYTCNNVHVFLLPYLPPQAGDNEKYLSE